MADQSIGSEEPYSGEAEILVVVGEGAEPTAALREAAALRDVLEALATAFYQKGIVARPRPGTMRVVEAPARRHSGGAWQHRLGIVAAAILALMASAVLAPSHLALAEAPLGEPVTVGTAPIGIGVNPATNRIYVANSVSANVMVIDGATNTVIGSPIAVGKVPAGVGINPATNRVYVVNNGDSSVSVIDGATNTVIGSPIIVGAGPEFAGVNPTTNRIYVPNGDDGTVTVIDGATNTVLGSPIPVGKAPLVLAVNPVTNRIYVANQRDSTVSVIDGATNMVIGLPIPVGKAPLVLAVNPVTNRIYVANQTDSTLSVIDGATNTVTGSPIPVGKGPALIAANPTTNQIYVANGGDASVTIIDGATNNAVGAPIPVGRTSLGVAVNPVTNRIYSTSGGDNNVTVLGIPFNTAPGTTTPGSTVTATWSKLSVLNGGDFVGLFEPSAPNTSPLSRVFTNGTASPGGGGVRDGSVDLPVPANLTGGGNVEVRLVAGASGGTLARLSDAAPVAANDSFSVPTAGVLNVPAPGVLANDTDPESLGLQAAVATNPAHGTVTLQPNGGFVYTPNATFTGADSFTYRAIDKSGVAATATATIAITAAPVAASDAFTVASGTVLNVPAPGVLTNDTDADSPSLQATVVANPGHGSLSLQPSGGFTYTPAANFAGTDTFVYQASDGTSVSTSVTATIAVTATPVAANDTFTISSGNTLTVSAPGVLANDADADSPVLQATPVTGPGHGALNLQASGALTYTPSADFAGTDTFTYRASDGTAPSNVATVTIAVTPTDCAPRPRVQAVPVPGSGKLQVHVESTPLSTQQPNPLRTLRFGTFQNAKVTLNGQPIANGQTFAVPSSNAIDFTVERTTPGQATTVPLTIVDGCGEWPTFVGGGTDTGF